MHDPLFLAGLSYVGRKNMFQDDQFDDSSRGSYGATHLKATAGNRAGSQSLQGEAGEGLCLE